MGSSLREEVEFVTDDVEIINILNVLGKNKERLWLWQDENKKGQRRINVGVIRKVDPVRKIFDLVPASSDGRFQFDRKLPISLYSKERKMACRTKHREIASGHIVLNIPSKVSFLSDSLAEKFDVIVEDNEELDKEEEES